MNLIVSILGIANVVLFVFTIVLDIKNRDRIQVEGARSKSSGRGGRL